MEIEQSRGGAQMASPAAWGYGPALAMPTLMGMMSETETQLQEGQVSVRLSVRRKYLRLTTMYNIVGGRRKDTLRL